MADHLFHFPSQPQTVAAMDSCITAIDAQIDEITGQLEKLYAARRALASMTGRDRKDSSAIVSAIEGANRAEYEGAHPKDASGRIIARPVKAVAS